MATISNNNQENNSKKPHVCARGGFNIIIGSGKVPEVGEELSFFGNGQEHFVTVEMYEGNKVKRNAELGFSDLHPAKPLKPIVEKMCNNQRMQQNKIKNEIQVNATKLQPVNGLAK